MHLMDLVLQGVRRFGESRKFSLKPGLNVVYGPTESGKSTLVECFLDLLYPDRIKDEPSTLVSWGDPAASRAGLTMASDRDIYRVLKDFKSGAISLTQYNPASQKYDPMAAEAVQISGLFAQSFGLPPFDVYYYLFLSSMERMPSALPIGPGGPMGEADLSVSGFDRSNPAVSGRTAAPDGTMITGGGSAPMGMALPGMGAPGGMALPGMSAPASPMMPGMTAPAMPMMPGMFTGMTQPGFVDDDMTPEQREKKLVQLREELISGEKIDELQYEIDGIQQKVFEVESKTKSASQFDEFLDSAKEQLDKYPALKRLPDNIDERLDRYDDLYDLQGAEVEKVIDVIRAESDDLMSINSHPPIYQELYSQIAAGTMVASIICFIVGGSVMGMGFLKGFSLLFIPGLGVLGWRIYFYVELAAKRTAAEAKMEELEEKKQGVIRKFQVEVAFIGKLMEDTDSDDIEELKGKIAKFRELDERYRSVLERKNKAVKELKIEVLEKQKKEFKAQIAKMEEQLRQYPPLSSDINTMRKEIKRLESVIAATNPNSKVLKSAKDESPPPAAGFAVPDLDGHTQVATAVPSPRVSSPGVSGAGDSGATRTLRRRQFGPTSASMAYEQLLQISARLFGTERNKLLNHVQQRLNLYIQAFFQKRYTEARIDPDGSMVLKNSDGKWVDFDQLTPAARDTGYLALQITLLELATQKKILPVILDNPAARLDDAAAKTAYTALKRLSEKTQVILFSTTQTPAKIADHTITLA